MSNPASPSNAAIERGRETTIRLLRLLAVAALVIPLLIFSFASFVAYRQTQALAQERIDRTLDVMQEQALKVFQSMTLALDTIDRLLGARTTAQVQADEPALHAELRAIQKNLPDVQSIWIFGTDGRPLVITRESPPPKLSYADNDYFTVPRDHPDAIYIGDIHQSVSGNPPYFSFNRARRDAAGRFAGVIEMSLQPNRFATFYSHLVSSPGLGFALVRDDGTVLARYPAPRNTDADERESFSRAIAAVRLRNQRGQGTQGAPVDPPGERIGLRRLGGSPVYVAAFLQNSEVRSEWMTAMAMHLIFGIPATLFLFVLLLTVLRRTQRLYAEIDQRLAVEESLRQAQRLDAIGHLTGGVAHDFNNLLTIILGNLDAAKRQMERWADSAHYQLGRRIENAMHGAARAATLTKRLLAFARQTPLKPEIIDINRLLRGMSEFLERTLGEDIALEIVGAAGLWPIETDAAELEAAILNLAVNARDAMPRGGKLTIETSNSYLDEAYCRDQLDVQPGQYVMIAVSDTGVGMRKEVLDHAFEPFFTTKPSGQGTGLGLSQVYGFVRQSGGHAKIYSEANEGTTVKMYLRRFPGIAAAAAAEAKAEPQGGRAGERVLVVEDDLDVRNYVVEALRELGYDVLQAADAAHALRLIDQHRNINLLLTDVVMPEMNGRKLADEARARNAAIKVLFMTGYSRNAIVHQGRLDPGVELIQKPLTSGDLAAAVRRVLDA